MIDDMDVKRAAFVIAVNTYDERRKFLIYKAGARGKYRVGEEGQKAGETDKTAM